MILLGKWLIKKVLRGAILGFVFTDGTDFGIPLRRIWNKLVDKADKLSNDDKEFRLILGNLMEQYEYPLNMTAKYENKAGRLVAF